MLRRLAAWLMLLGLLVVIARPAISQMSDDQVKKIFLTGRGLGAAYYHLIYLNNSARQAPYAEIQDKYQNAFQNLNIANIIIDDFKINSDSTEKLKQIRCELYGALEKQDLNEFKLSIAVDKFAALYEGLRQNFYEKYGLIGNWLLSIGFYTSFQLESIKSEEEKKLFLSGFSGILEKIPFKVPADISEDLNKIKEKEKLELTTTEIEELKVSLTDVIEFFSNYSANFAENKTRELIGLWQGILLSPDFQRHEIKLQVKNENNKLKGSMDIENIAQNITINNLDMVDNYFSFMFKPLGTDKLFIKFDAKMLNDVFTGEVVDVLGEKGYWILTKPDNTTDSKKFEILDSYIKNIESDLKLKSTEQLPESDSEKQKTQTKPSIPELRNKITLKNK